MNRRAFLQGAATTAIAVAAGTPILLRGIRTHEVEAKRVRLTLGLNQPLRLVALGDIHFDPLYENSYLEQVADSITELSPDIVVYTGDFVTARLTRLHDLAAILGKISARIGSFATLGNHDHWTGGGAVTRALEREGIRVLRNDCFPLPGEEDVFVSALDSYWAGTPDPKILLRTSEKSRHVLLVHEPDPFTNLTDPRIRLQISGHTHGGQIRAPYVGALLLPKWGRLFQQGLYLRDGRCLYVNRGIGTLRPHVRYHCRPEITVFELA